MPFHSNFCQRLITYQTRYSLHVHYGLYTGNKALISAIICDPVIFNEFIKGL
jgi:hypothetical protein